MVDFLSWSRFSVTKWRPSPMSWSKIDFLKYRSMQWCLGLQKCPAGCSTCSAEQTAWRIWHCRLNWTASRWRGSVCFLVKVLCRQGKCIVKIIVSYRQKPNKLQISLSKKLISLFFDQHTVQQYGRYHSDHLYLLSLIIIEIRLYYYALQLSYFLHF